MPPIAMIGAMAAGSIGSAIIGSHAAGKAADTQSAAANHAADLERQSAQEALAFQKQEYADQQKNIAPWLKSGQGAVTSLSNMVRGGGFPSWNQQFQAPTGVTEQNDPGFQFRLQQGQQALERSASARGGLLSGGTGKALQQFGQDYASNEYGNVYNRALGEYQQRYNQFEQNQANQYNRLAGISGTGQVAAGQLAQSGQQAASGVGGILMNSAAQQGNALQNAAYQRGSGYAQQANIWGGLLNSVPSYYNMYQNMQNQGGN